MTLILIYLLPILFMLHEFEEMVMLPAWIEKNEKELSRRFPALRSKLSFLQSPAFGIAVCEEFVIISACTMATIITGNMLFWYICLLAFSLHFVAHIIQFFIIRKYIPAIVSTVLCCPHYTILYHSQIYSCHCQHRVMFALLRHGNKCWSRAIFQCGKRFVRCFKPGYLYSQSLPDANRNAQNL